MKYNRLFSPIEIKPGFTLKNRILMPALHHGYTLDGTPSPQFRAYYKARAKGGAGLIVLGACRFEGTGAKPDVLKLVDEEDVVRLKEVVDELHAEGAKVAVQLFHAGRYVASGKNADGVEALSPSAVYSSFSRSTPKEMSVEEIHSVIAAWAAGADRARRAGFDAVEIIGSAGYLITQFLSPVTNLRTDEYGGSPENRRRFPLEVVQAVRAAVGEDYPILYRISGKDFIPGSNGLEETMALAAELEQAGVDLLNVTGGWHETTVPQLPGDLPRGGLSYLAQGIKSVVNIPVCACNRINSPDTAEELLAMGKCDLVGMGRPLLADPELPIKAQSGHPELIRPCVACNQGCLVGAFFDRPVVCLANGLCGHESEWLLTPGQGSVLVIGGGCAGCECAIRLAQRGYQVTLWEKTSALGGQLRLAGKCPAKGEFNGLIAYYEQALAQAGVTVVLNKTADVDSVVAECFDKVVVAIGGRPDEVKLPGAVTCEDIFSGDVVPGKDVVIVGGTFKGLETARYLARKSALSPEEHYFLVTQRAETADTAAAMANRCGRTITVVEQEKRMGAGYEPGVSWTVMQELARLGVKQRKLCKVVAVTDTGVTCEQQDKEGNVTLVDIPCDTLVFAAGVHPDESLTRELMDMGVEAVSLGNCAKLGRAIGAISDAVKTAYTL